MQRLKEALKVAYLNSFKNIEIMELLNRFSWGKAKTKKNTPGSNVELKATTENKTVMVAKKRVSLKLNRTSKPPVELEMDNFQTAVSVASDAESPTRLLLYGYYDKTNKDAHVLSQLRTARFTVQQAPFFISQNNTENKELSVFFESQWFIDFVKLALDAEFWGHSLIEFSDISEDGFFTWTKLIPRMHVRPETQEVLIDVNDDKGISYLGSENDWFLIEVGNNRDLGLFEIATKEVIWKQYARADWSKATERYGMPLLAIKTEATENDELDQMQDFAENFGSHGYVILNKDDEVEIQTQSGGNNFHEMYKSKADFCDAQLSKLINGQTGSSDEKAYVGSAEVHERILNNYSLARMKRIQNLINDKLIPFMTNKGYPLADCKFQYTELLKKETSVKETNLDKEDTKKKRLTYTY